VWAEVLRRTEREPTASFFQHLSLTALDPAAGQAVLTSHAAREMVSFAASPIGREKIAHWLQQVTGRHWQVRVGRPDGGGGVSELEPESPASGSDKPASREERRAAMQHPLVKEVSELFGARLVDLHREPPPQQTTDPAESNSDGPPDPEADIEADVGTDIDT